MELKDCNVIFICKNCGEPATWVKDEQLQVNFLDWQCHKCGALIFTTIDQNGNIVFE